MSILTGEVILEEIAKGSIVIDPFDESRVGPGSIDLGLGNKFRVFERQNEVFHVLNDSDVEVVTNPIEISDDESMMLKPGETILGITREKITLASDISGWLEGRSRFARLGLGVHITAGFMNPGISNYQVLEMTNLSPTPLALHPGVLICQMIFERCEGAATYSGRFQNQERP
jgi:dCTP deaminase